MTQQSDKGTQTHQTGSEELSEARARKAGTGHGWHFGRVTQVGSFEAAGGRAVTIVWEEGGMSCQQGSITDEQWEVLKLAFSTTGRIAVLSDEEEPGWRYDFRFLEAVR